MAVMILVALCPSSYGEISKEIVESAWKRIAKADGFKSQNNYTIHVTTGLMKILDTEDEMAGIWGHEIGHVRLGHYTKGRLRSAGWSLAGKLLQRKTGDDRLKALHVFAEKYRKAR